MTVRSLHITMAGHPLPKPFGLRVEDYHGRWYKNFRLVSIQYDVAGKAGGRAEVDSGVGEEGDSPEGEVKKLPE